MIDFHIINNKTRWNLLSENDVGTDSGLPLPFIMSWLMLYGANIWSEIGRMVEHGFLSNRWSSYFMMSNLLTFRIENLVSLDVFHWNDLKLCTWLSLKNIMMLISNYVMLLCSYLKKREAKDKSFSYEVLFCFF